MSKYNFLLVIGFDNIILIFYVNHISLESTTLLFNVDFGSTFFGDNL